MWGETGGWGWGWIGLGAIHMALFWGLIIVAIVAFVKLLSGSDNRAPHHKDAMDILKERYARGDISREEFEEKKRHLRE